MKRYDFLIVGSGFAGSVTAMALRQSGYDVCLVEKGRHPRFAIGESSTPIADMILRTLSEKYNLPKLKMISRYGTWQDNYPEVVCGLKRGFSYYVHHKHEPFEPGPDHSRELLVAASENNHNSDTNWLRSDVDHFLFEEAGSLGVDCFEETTIREVTRNAVDEYWKVVMDVAGEKWIVESRWIIDATGSAAFSNRFLNTKTIKDGFHTHSSAIFSHFENVPTWIEKLEKNGATTDDYPYQPDDSALHQVLDEGWMWMLRFKNGLLSAGLVLDRQEVSNNQIDDPRKLWNSTLQNYPSLEELFRSASLAPDPGEFIQTGRMQRKLDRLFAEGWIALPHTGGFIDPLHSTGIAFTLSGVEKILNLFDGDKSTGEIKKGLKKYQDDFFKELSLIDMLVSSSYKSRKNPELFFASAMLYFIASVRYEQARLRGEIPETFLCAGEIEIRDIVSKSFKEIRSCTQNRADLAGIGKVVSSIRARIEPFNNVGLMDPDAKNMYEHTAVVM